MDMKRVNKNNDCDYRDDGLGKKERFIVSWTKEEDDILREQIRIHGTENWPAIASKFKDKSTRQCRRRWFTYLNSEFKIGGWSPEEDKLLVEAQRILGNRWTEIAKVVSGRTDNAVKNRFNTLCKKRAKIEAFAKEKSSIPCINLNNRRVLFPCSLNTTGDSKNPESHRKNRPPTLAFTKDHKEKEEEIENTVPFHSTIGHIRNESLDKRAFLKNDPKILVLMQQAELLSSLATKVHLEKTEQSIENAWTVLRDFLEENKEKDPFTTKMEVSDEEKSNDEAAFDYSNSLISPIHMTPLFKALAAAILSPKFSESVSFIALSSLKRVFEENLSPLGTRDPLVQEGINQEIYGSNIPVREMTHITKFVSLRIRNRAVGDVIPHHLLLAYDPGLLFSSLKFKGFPERTPVSSEPEASLPKMR